MTCRRYQKRTLYLPVAKRAPYHYAIKLKIIKWIFHSYWDVAITGEELLILTYTRQLGFLNVPHLLRHVISVYKVISEDPWHSHLLPSVWQWNCQCLFERLGSNAARIRKKQPYACQSNAQPIAPPPRCSLNKRYYVHVHVKTFTMNIQQTIIDFISLKWFMLS